MTTTEHPFAVERHLECGRRLLATADGWSCKCGATFTAALAPNGWAVRVVVERAATVAKVEPVTRRKGRAA